jgi:hypothetical protein
MQQNGNCIRRIWRWASNQIVQNAPNDSALCAFDCRKNQCTSVEWDICERRISNASGELMPAVPDADKK